MAVRARRGKRGDSWSVDAGLVQERLNRDAHPVGPSHPPAWPRPGGCSASGGRSLGRMAAILHGRSAGSHCCSADSRLAGRVTLQSACRLSTDPLRWQFGDRSPRIEVLVGYDKLGPSRSVSSVSTGRVGRSIRQRCPNSGRAGQFGLSLLASSRPCCRAGSSRRALDSLSASADPVATLACWPRGGHSWRKASSSWPRGNLALFQALSHWSLRESSSSLESPRRAGLPLAWAAARSCCGSASSCERSA